MEKPTFILSEKLYELAVQAVLETRGLIASKENEELAIAKKGQGNFVTSIDKCVEQFLIKRLAEILPKAGFIAEETGRDEKKCANWIIDPIDGTSNYIYGFDYAVSVALQIEQEVIFGVVYSPIKNILYVAKSGSGAFKRDADGVYKKIFTKDYPEAEGIMLFGLPYDRERTSRIFSIASNLYALASDIKRIGPASLDICTVAEGKGKLYFELNLEIWDIAAGVVILNEAGGEYRRIDDLFLFGNASAIEEAIVRLRGAK